MIKNESKIIGMNPLWISALLTVTFLIVCTTGGDNVDWGNLGVEVIYPFYIAVVVGEWCKTRIDPMFEVILAQGKSLFEWMIRRFVLLFALTTLFAVAAMFGLSMIKQNVSVLDLMQTFFPTAFFLSSICMFLSLLSKVPHMPAMAVGVIWLFSIMAISLLRFLPVQYVYLFARFAGVDSLVYSINKAVLFLMGIVLWIGIYAVCKSRIFNKNS